MSRCKLIDPSFFLQYINSSPDGVLNIGRVASSIAKVVGVFFKLFLILDWFVSTAFVMVFQLELMVIWFFRRIGCDRSKNLSSKFGVYEFLVFREILAHSSNPYISDYLNRDF
jgi:hypothetical protein